MELLTTRVAIFEQNRTRADLYGIWLDDCDARITLTESNVEAALDESIAIVVMDRGFAEGAAPSILGTIEACAPAARVIGIRDRSEGFPDLPVENQLIKPVFKEDLQELAERFIYQANYHHALRLYYQTTSNLVYLEVNDTPDVDEDRYQQLSERADRLKELIGALRHVMVSEDLQAVKQSVTFEGEFEQTDTAEKIDSKYRPDRCSQCRADWRPAKDGNDNVRQLGANIWRCGSCGHVQMKTDPSHRGIGSYRQ